MRTDKLPQASLITELHTSLNETVDYIKEQFNQLGKTVGEDVEHLTARSRRHRNDINASRGLINDTADEVTTLSARVDSMADCLCNCNATSPPTSNQSASPAVDRPDSQLSYITPPTVVERNR